MGEVPEVPQGTFPTKEASSLHLRGVEAVLVAPMRLHGRKIAGRSDKKQGRGDDQAVGECPRWRGGFPTALKDGAPAARSRWSKVFGWRAPVGARGRLPRALAFFGK